MAKWITPFVALSAILLAGVAFGKTTAVCGDGIIEQGEQCDGSNLAGQTCQSAGFTGALYRVPSTCHLNTSACTSGTLSPLNVAMRRRAAMYNFAW